MFASGLFFQRSILATQNETMLFQVIHGSSTPVKFVFRETAPFFYFKQATAKTVKVYEFKFKGLLFFSFLFKIIYNTFPAEINDAWQVFTQWLSS